MAVTVVVVEAPPLLLLRNAVASGNLFWGTNYLELVLEGVWGLHGGYDFTL